MARCLGLFKDCDEYLPFRCSHSDFAEDPRKIPGFQFPCHWTSGVEPRERNVSEDRNICEKLY
jgi:hypothetical protein